MNWIHFALNRVQVLIAAELGIFTALLCGVCAMRDIRKCCGWWEVTCPQSLWRDELSSLHAALYQQDWWSSCLQGLSSGYVDPMKLTQQMVSAHRSVSGFLALVAMVLSSGSRFERKSLLNDCATLNATSCEKMSSGFRVNCLILFV